MAVTLDQPGQVRKGTRLGDIIERVCFDKVVLDIGTWNGRGSVRRALDGGAKHVTTIEADPRMHAFAMRELSSFDAVRCEYGKVSTEMMTLEDAKAHPRYVPEAETWYAGERALFDRAPLLEFEPGSYVDVLILDGGEFSTMGDWRVCKHLVPKHGIVVLDDVRAIKCWDIDAELTRSESWKLVERGDDTNGWAVYERLA